MLLALGSVSIEIIGEVAFADFACVSMPEFSLAMHLAIDPDAIVVMPVAAGWIT